MAVTLAVAASMVQAPPVQAADTTGSITEFAVGLDPLSSPAEIAASGDGTVWFTEQGNPRLGRIDPTGTITEIPIPQPASGITEGPDGLIWFAGGGHVARVNADLTITDFTPATTSAANGPITTGPDGALWFGAGGQNVARMTTAGVVTDFVVGAGINNGPADIVTGPDGNLWFTTHARNCIGRITPSGTYTYFSLDALGSRWPLHLTVGPDDNIWFTESLGSAIGRITPSGIVSEFPVPGGARVADITSGPDGALWFTEQFIPGIGRMTTDGAVLEFTTGIAASSGPYGIVTGADANLWFTENSANAIGRISSGAVGVAPVVRLDPTSRVVPVGGSTTLTAAASGIPAPRVRWESSADGVAWTTIVNASRSTLTLRASAAPTTTWYRAVFTNATGSATTAPATVRASGQVGAPTISRSSATVYPYRDAYLDTVTLRVTTAVPASGTARVIVAGRVVWVATLARSTTRAVIWTGRTSSGATLPAGVYAVQVTLRGTEGTTVVRTVPVTVSLKRLVALPFDMTVLARNAVIPNMGHIPSAGTVAGACRSTSRMSARTPRTSRRHCRPGRSAMDPPGSTPARRDGSRRSPPT